jgi:hypothetical protein
MIKIKKDCRFEYILFYKAVSKKSSKKEYIGTFKCLKHIHPININFFSFKIHETGIVEYQTFIGQVYKYRVDNIFYSENQVFFEQEHQGFILHQKTYYNLLRKKPDNASNFNIIIALFKELNEAGFVYKIRIEDEINANEKMIKRKMI